MNHSGTQPACAPWMADLPTRTRSYGPPSRFRAPGPDRIRWLGASRRRERRVVRASCRGAAGLPEERRVDQEVIVGVDPVVVVQVPLRIRQVRRLLEEPAVDAEIVIGVDAPVEVGVAVVA